MAVAVDHELALFGIGSTLREARVRRGISLEQVERDTCIRALNLERIEDELFDELPGDVYTAGFVRTYADYLGLDGDRFVELYRETRFVEPEPIVHHGIVDAPRPRLRLWALLALVAAAVAAGSYLLLRGDEAAQTPTPPAQQPVAASKPDPGPLVIRAARGATWVSVRFEGPRGERVWQGTLRRGRMLKFGLARPLWVGIGRPEKVNVAVAGTLVELSPSRTRFVFGE